METTRSDHHRRVQTRYSVEDRQRHIRQYRMSGQSKSAYCREQQINPNTFNGWLKRLSATGGFAEVMLAGNGAELPSDCVQKRIEVRFPGGVRVFIPEQGLLEKTSRLIREVIGC